MISSKNILLTLAALFLGSNQCLFAVAQTGGSEVYTSGDLILANPVEASTIFLFVILVSAILEFGIDTASDVKNKYFRVMFAALNQEVMIVGVLVLGLTFAETVYDWPLRWILIFKWSMMALFLMAIYFLIIVLTILGAVMLSDKQWRKFEAEKMDSGQALSSKELQYKNAFNKFQQALTAFGYDASQGIRFSDYIAKLQRRNVVALTDLTWVSWVCLATLVILNALRAEATRRMSEFGDENIEDEMTTGQRLFNYLSFIVVIGYGTLVVFIVMYFVLSRRLDDFLQNKVAVRTDDAQGTEMNSMALLTQDNLDDSKAFLFRRSQEASLEIVQVVVLFLEWYVAAFFLSYAYQITSKLGGVAIPLILFALIPVFIFLLMLPWMLWIIATLSGLGTNLNEPVVQKLLRKAGIPEDQLPERMRDLRRKARVKKQGGAGATTIQDSDWESTLLDDNNQTQLGRGMAGKWYNPQGHRQQGGPVMRNALLDLQN